LIALDCGFSVLDELKAKCPKRVIDVGCREQAAIGLAAGLAIGGFKPIVYSIAKFILWRAAEFIEQDIVRPKLNVKIVGYGAGSYFCRLGKSHTTGRNDIVLANLLGLVLYIPDVQPGDDPHSFWETKHPAYLRLTE